MKQVRIILKSGKEVQWETDSEPMADIMHAKEPCGYITVADGRTIHVAKDEIAAIIITPMVKCPKCGGWVLPESYATMANNKMERPFEKCPKCGEEIVT